MERVLGIEELEVHRRMVRHLASISNSTTFHDVQNKAVARIVTWLTQELNSLAIMAGEARVEIEGGIPFINGHPVRVSRELRNQLSNLYGQLTLRGCGGFKLRDKVEGVAVMAFFRCMKELPENLELSHYQSWLNTHEAQNILLLGPRQLVTGVVGGTGISVRVAAAEALRAYVRAIAAVESARQQGLATRIPPAMFRAIQGLVSVAINEPRNHLALASLKEEVHFELRHPINTTILALGLGVRLGMPRALLMELGLAAIVCALVPHSADDPIRAAAIADQADTPRMTAVRVRRMLAIYEHMLPLDRSGSDTLVSGPLHLFSRIIAIARDYDRLTTMGVGSMLPGDALQHLRTQSGTRYDEDLVDVFINLIGRYPVGTAVRLSTGEVALIYHTHADASLSERPVIRILRDERGKAVRNGRIIDLAMPEHHDRKVVGVVEPDLLDMTAVGLFA